MTLSFSDCEINLERRELWRAKRAVHVEPQVFDLLVYLVQNRDRVVSKDDLIASVWGGRIVSESTLTSRINAARTAVGDNGREQQLIRTIPRKGLRFIGAVNAPADDNQQALAADLPSDGIHEPSRPVLPLPDRPAIAVLPFTNMRGDPEQEYFFDGISEDIITAPAELRWFFVIARNSSFIYKGKAVFPAGQAFYGVALCYCGRWEEGDLAARRALRLSPRDPFSALYYGIAAYAQFIGHHYDEAIRLSHEAIWPRGDFVGGHRALTAAAMAGKHDVATAALQELRRAQPNITLAWIAKD